MGKTYKFSQREIAQNVDKNSARKVFDLNLSFGPYRLACTRNGKHIAFGGRKGHVAVYFYERARVSGEFHVRETVRDLCFLHDESMLAVAQKNCVCVQRPCTAPCLVCVHPRMPPMPRRYIYDKRGTELHCLRNHPDVYALDFLPYHYLMCSIGRQGVLRYQVRPRAVRALPPPHTRTHPVLRRTRRRALSSPSTARAWGPAP